MGNLLQDIRFALRQLRKSPGFTLVAVLSLALGIGANTTVFSLLDAVMLRSLPVQNPEQIVDIATREAGGEPHSDFSYPLYTGLRDHNGTFSEIVAYSDTNFGLTAGDQTERIRGEFVSANYFSGLGVQPTIGSAFTPDDERPGAPRVAVISDALWTRRLNREPSALQKTITLNGRTFSVVGVAPSGFSGLLRGLQTDVWISLPHQADFDDNPKLLSTPTQSWLTLAGRLKPNVTIQQAESDLTALLPGVSEEARAGGYRLDHRGLVGRRTHARARARDGRCNSWNQSCDRRPSCARRLQPAAAPGLRCVAWNADRGARCRLLRLRQ
jgi:hypothetical protein